MLHDLRDPKLFPKLTPDQMDLCRQLGDTVHLHDGETLFEAGKGEYCIYVVESGRLRILRGFGPEEQIIAAQGPGEFTGELSVLTGAQPMATATAIGDTSVYRICPDRLRKLVCEDSPLGKIFITVLAHRSQQVGMYFSQQEKMAALGRMSAGLAHELNNPATAARRASALLIEKVLETPVRMSAIEKRFTAEHREFIQAFARKIKDRAVPQIELDPIERSDREQEVLTWLEEHDVPRPEDIACQLVSHGVTPAILEQWRNKLGETFVHALFWVATVTGLAELAADIESSTGRIADLVCALKEYTYMDRAKLQDIDVHHGLDNTLKILHHKWKNGVVVRRLYAPDLPSICAYAGELNQVWTNLIDNAIDAMNGKGTLTIRTFAAGDRIGVEICDTGSGIPLEIQSRIFEPFFTTKAVGQGTGLGLDISYRIITHRHGGQIKLRSRPGETCFVVFLRKSPPKADERLEEARETEPETVMHTQSSER
ncbi:MAG: ATP-binding protein [Bryobacteraceae bacterium]